MTEPQLLRHSADSENRRSGTAASEAGDNDPLVAAVVLSVNQRENTLRCLESLRLVRGPRLVVVLWDNGSTDGTEAAVRLRYPEVRYHRSPENLGAAGGRNAGARFADSCINGISHYLFLDNDTVVRPEFLLELIAPQLADARIAQTAAKIMFLRTPEIINMAGGANIRFWSGNTMPFGYGERDVGQYEQSFDCIAPTCCTLVRRDAFHAISGFDTIFDPYGCEDLDFSARLVAAGYRCVYAPRSVILHDPSQTFGGGQYTGAYARKKVDNWLIYLGRHGRASQKLSFALFGIPYRACTATLRELRRGNWRGVAGLAGGFMQQVLSRLGLRRHGG